MGVSKMCGECLLVGLIGVAGVACTQAEGDDGMTPPGGTGAVLCPEANPFSPTNPNSVLINDVVLQQDETWTADKVYLIGDDFKIENHTLTVEAGTTICLYQRGQILVGQGIDPGEIHLNGTADKPITITAPPATSDATKPDVFHRGIVFDTFMASTLSYVNIWYGGPGGGSAAWAFQLTSSSHGTDATKPLLVDHLTVGAVQSKGVSIATPLGIADGSSIRFTGYAPVDSSGPALDAVAELNISASQGFAKAFDLTGASIPDEAKHVNLRVSSSEGKIDTDTDLVDFGLPYLWKNELIMQIAGAQNDPVGSTLTIHEGVTLKMDGGLIIGGTSGTAQGNLVIAGTADKPVVLTSTSDTPAAGDWEGLYFVSSFFDPAKTKIDHAQILYAGVDPSNGQQINRSVGRCGTNYVGAVMITGALGTTDGPAITNTTIAHSLSDGIVSGANNSGGYVQGNYSGSDITFEDIAGSSAGDNGPCI